MDLASGDTLSLLPNVNDQGSIEIGDGSTDLDLKIFLGSTTEFVEFNVGDSILNLEGVKLNMLDGGTVTQATNKSTAVTLNTHSGQITMNNAALGAGAEVAFTVNNTVVNAESIIVVNVASGPTAAEEHIVWVGAVASGSFDIAVANVSASSASDALVINFCVFGGSAT